MKAVPPLMKRKYVEVIRAVFNVSPLPSRCSVDSERSSLALRKISGMKALLIEIRFLAKGQISVAL